MEIEITSGGHGRILKFALTILIITADRIENTNAGKTMINTRQLLLLKPHPRKVGGLFSIQSSSLIYTSVLVLS